MKTMWNMLMNQTEKLNDDDLTELLNKAHPALEKAITNWNN